MADRGGRWRCSIRTGSFRSSRRPAPSPASSTAQVRDLPIISPHGHTEPRWYAENLPFPDPAQLFVVPDHYVFRMLCSQGVPLADLGVPRDGRRAGRDRPAPDLAAVRRELPPAARHALAAVARPYLRDGVRPRHPPLGGDGRRRLRPYRRLPGAAGVPAARALRALRHRGDLDHRRRARRPALAQGDPRFGLEGPGRSRLPPGRGGRSRVRGLRRQRRAARRDHRLRHLALGGLSRGAPRAARLLQGAGRHQLRPRPRHRPHRGPAAGGGGGALRAGARRQGHARRRPTPSAARC